MSEYRKKPVVIEAFRWTGGPDQTENPQWCVDAILAGTVRFENSGTPDVAMLIDTLEGTHRANQGDFIIKGVKGELYPCKPDIFALTYEPASTPTDETATATIEGMRGDVRKLNLAIYAITVELSNFRIPKQSRINNALEVIAALNPQEAKSETQTNEAPND